MIVATAGHIDHGKTALIKALTGVDADRLPEEKKRGITVDLGFAYGAIEGGQTIGFVDVPGHEKLVRTMLAGALGVDFVLLCVAADDGIMPQTREHLAIIDLLGLKRGMVALTKVDKAAGERVVAVAGELQALMADTVLAGAPILPVSARDGSGLDGLRRVLSQDMLDVAAARDGAQTERGFRLAVDRAFSLPGTGLVVTGMVHAGQVTAGDRLVLRRTGSSAGMDLRVRGVHAANASVEHGTAGQRCALNITGARLSKAEIARGDWLVAPMLPAQASRLDGELRLLPNAIRALRHWTPVHVHVGAADISGRVSLLEGASLAPGERALCQLVLDEPTAVLAGDRFVIRDQSARDTLGGGQVIDPQPPARGARKPERLLALRALADRDDGNALRALLALSSDGVDLDGFVGSRNIAPARREDMAALGIRFIAGGTERLLEPERWHLLRTGLLAAVRAYSDQHPDRFGATPRELLRMHPADGRAAAAAALDDLCRAGEIVRFGQVVRMPDHAVSLPSQDEERWREVEHFLTQSACDPPRLAAVAEALGITAEELAPLLEKLGRMGRLARISRHYYLLPKVVRLLAGHAVAAAEAHEAALLTVGQFRELAGIGRNATMPVLEFFDRVGLTSRHQDGRRIRGSAEQLFNRLN